MPALNLKVEQLVQIPELEMSDGSTFIGRVQSIDGMAVKLTHNPELVIVKRRLKPSQALTMVWRSGKTSDECEIHVREITETEIEVEASIPDRRHSLRVHCDMDLFITELQAEDVTEVARNVLAKVNPLNESESQVEFLMRAEESEDTMLAEMTNVRMLLEKLTYQVEHLTQVIAGDKAGEDPDEEELIPHVSDCSATGVAIRVAREIEIGTFFKLRLVFREIPKLEILAVGVVARSESRAEEDRHSDHWDIGMRFTHIHQADRERIVRHIFKIQRNQLRDRSQAA